MLKIFLNKKFQIILLLVVLWFAGIFLLSFFVFHAGIYSCGDAVELGYITNNQIENCRLQQTIGNIILVIFFWPAIILGTLTNQLAFSVFANFDGSHYGDLAFYLGAIPGLVVDLLFVTWLIYRWKNKKRNGQ